MPDEIKPVISEAATAEITDFYQRLCQYTEENGLEQPTATDIADIFWLTAQISLPSPSSFPQSNTSNFETETTKDKENLPEIKENIKEDDIKTPPEREKDLIGDYLTPLQPKADKKKEKEKRPEYPITTPKSKEGKFYIKVPDAPTISQRRELVKIFHQLRRLIPSTVSQSS